MRRIESVIGCSDDSNVIEALNNIATIVTPTVVYNNGGVESNFDILFNFDGSDSKLQSRYSGIMSIGMDRLPKSLQVYDLNRGGINTPYTTYVMSFNSKFESHIPKLVESMDCDQIIIKSNNGAKGVGQVLISTLEFMEVFTAVYADTFNAENFSIGGLGASDHDAVAYMVESIKSGDFLIQEKLDIKYEWRIIWFSNESPIIIPRQVSDHWQANTQKSSNKIVDMSAPTVDEKFIAKCDEFFRKTYKNVPFIAFDVYKTKSGEFGIFEYQMQFGFRTLSYVGRFNEFLDKATSSMNELIKNM